MLQLISDRRRVISGCFNAVSSPLFGPVKGLVRTGDRFINVLPHSVLGNTDGNGNLKIRADFRKGTLFDLGPNPLRADQRALDVRLRHDDQELLSAVASAKLRVAQGVFHSGRDGRENGIARLMPMDVVDIFEVVDVQDTDAENAAAPRRKIPFVVQEFQNMAAVMQAGQDVPDGHFLYDFDIFYLFCFADAQLSPERADRSADDGENRQKKGEEKPLDIFQVEINAVRTVDLSKSDIDAVGEQDKNADIYKTKVSLFLKPFKHGFKILRYFFHKT